MKRIYLNTLITTCIVIAVFAVICRISQKYSSMDKTVTVGFMYVGDESTPYTNSFIRAQEAIENEFGSSVKVVVKNNIAEGHEERALQELVDAECDIVFTTSFGYASIVKRFAGENPGIQFCEATGTNANEEPFYENYHTFMGEIYEARYVAGVVAGMKLEELIKEKRITPSQAVIGYVAAYPYAEVISGYTAFLLGARSIVPKTTMKVKYVNTWSSYVLEKNAAAELIDEGCVIISQHSDTAGPAVACEETKPNQNVYHVGYNQGMIDIAPTTSLISSRINWVPYMVEATEAIMKDKKIEKYVKGHVHGNDIGAGFNEGWIEMLDLNELIVAPGTKEKMNHTIQELEKGHVEVFKGDYIGVKVNNPKEKYDLSKGYQENATSSAPTFNYILKDVIKIVS